MGLFDSKEEKERRLRKKEAKEKKIMSFIGNCNFLILDGNLDGKCMLGTDLGGHATSGHYHKCCFEDCIFMKILKMLQSVLRGND